MPLNVNTPELFAVVTALAAPERLTVEPAPRDVGLIVPVILSLVTLSETVVERVTAPLTPEIVTLCDPAGVCDDVVTVITELPEPVIDGGLNDADAPAGSPDALNATAPLKPDANLFAPAIGGRNQHGAPSRSLTCGLSRNVRSPIISPLPP